METEYQAVLEIMQQQIKLTPYNPKKKLRLVIDGASSIGTGFILVQFRDDKTRRKDATSSKQVQVYCPKGETLAQLKPKL